MLSRSGAAAWHLARQLTAGAPSALSSSSLACSAATEGIRRQQGGLGGQQQQQQRSFMWQREGGLDLRWLALDSLVVDDAAHRSLVQAAFRERKLSFGFSGGGCLFPYYIGVVGALRDGGVLTEGVKVGGASAGSIIAACHQSRLPLDYVTEQCLRLMGELRAQGSAWGKVGERLEWFLRQSLPEDAHERCQDTTYVAVTPVYPYPQRQLVSQFQDKEDLLQALLASCHVPYYLDGRPYTVYRGVPCIDGGITKFIPIAPQTVGIRVCCFPAHQMNPYYRIGISPDNFEPWPYSLRQMLALAFEPAAEEFTVAFIEKGKRDAQAWMEAMGLQAEHRDSSKKERKEEGEVAAAKKAATAA